MAASATALTAKAARRRPETVDIALGLLLTVALEAEMLLLGGKGFLAAEQVGALMTTIPLIWRTVAPVIVVAVATGGYALAIVLGLPGDQSLLINLAPAVAVYSLGAHGSPAGIAVGGALALAAYAVAVLAGADASSGDLLLSAAVVLGALLVGRAVRTMGFESERLQARAVALEREGDERASAAVAEERARISRELHDVIGHSISVMGVQAGAVRRRLAPDQEREREALLAVERVGRDAIEEMRRLLGFLRAEHDDAAAALPTLARLGELVDEMRRAGMEVDLRLEGDLDGVPPGRALAAYRIAQEALTNALRHARGARVTVEIRRGPAELEIKITDDGADVGGPRPGTGHGLVGMRERVALYGGTLTAGRRPQGGFAITARLPAAGE